MKKLVSIVSVLFLLIISNTHSMEYYPAEFETQAETSNPLHTFITNLNAFIGSVQSTTVFIDHSSLNEDLNKLRNDYVHLTSPRCFGPYPFLLKNEYINNIINRLLKDKYSIDNVQELLNGDIYFIKYKLSGNHNSVLGESLYLKASTDPKLTLLGIGSIFLVLGSITSELETCIKSILSASIRIGILYGASKLLWQYTIRPLVLIN